MEKICPLFIIANCCLPSGEDIGTDCMRQECELWNERFGMCSFAVDAYLKGQEDWRAERAELKGVNDEL